MGFDARASVVSPTSGLRSPCWRRATKGKITRRSGPTARNGPSTSKHRWQRLFAGPGRRRHMERVVFVYTTYPSVVEAETAGRVLLERELAACVNILPGMI